jgi:hypothetical protein
MFVPNLPLHEGLRERSRLRSVVVPASGATLWELAWLIGMGVVAALATTFLDFSLRIPGHAILRVVFPMSLGLALVPRRGAGLTMGVSALATVACCGFAGARTPGLGATTSLVVMGPLLDATLWRVRSGWILYGGFALAGLLSNLIAFAARGAGRLAGLGPAVRGGGGGGGGRMGAGVDPWWSSAPLSYMACGLLAGLVCGAIWFASRPRRQPESEETHG